MKNVWRALDAYVGSSGNPRSWLAGYLAAVVGVALVTCLIALVRDRAAIANISSLYLIVVLAVAATFGGGPAIAGSLLAFLTFDWFFVQPVGQLNVSDPDEWLALLLFLVTAVVTSQLAAALRRRAAEARRRERETLALYALNTLIAQDNDPHRIIANVAKHFAPDLDLVGATALLPESQGKLAPAVSRGWSVADAEWDRHAAEWVFRYGDLVTTGEPGRPSRWERGRRDASERSKPDGHGAPASVYLQLRSADHAVGVLWIVRATGAPPLTVEQRRFLRAAGQQIGMALERTRLRSEAAEAEALRRADEIKSALLNSVSHDLRTPLALIKAAAGSLRQRDVEWSSDEREAFALAIEQDADRLNRIVANLLDVSQIESGNLHPDRQYYPLATLVDDVIARLGPLLTAHPLNVEVPDDLPPVFVDYVAIDRVLSNLLENVEHHTPEGTAIRVSARREGDRVVVLVADDGPGIPSSDLAHLFDKFYRGQAPRRGARRGSGLGLAVARGLLEAHGERIFVESAPGAGATFRFTLPITDNRGAQKAAGRSER